MPYTNLFIFTGIFNYYYKNFYYINSFNFEMVFQLLGFDYYYCNNYSDHYSYFSHFNYCYNFASNIVYYFS